MARASFPEGPPIRVEDAHLVAGAGASGGAFMGNYDSAEILVIGFSMMFEKFPTPSDVALKWRGNNETFQRGIQASLFDQTGVWHRFAFSLNSKIEGGWDGVGSEATFQSALTNIDLVSLLVKVGPDAVDVYLDDIFIDRLHAGTRFQATTNGYGDITWSYVRSNYTYQLEYADVLTAGWSTAAVVTATSSNLITTIPLTNSALRAYRLNLP
jgi:hypothetical protein